MKETLVLREQEFFYRIIISQESKYFGLEGLLSLQREIPATSDIIAMKVSSPFCKMYCIGKNHSDFMGIEGRLGVKSEML